MGGGGGVHGGVCVWGGGGGGKRRVKPQTTVKSDLKQSESPVCTGKTGKMAPQNICQNTRKTMGIEFAHVLYSLTIYPDFKDTWYCDMSSEIF